MKTTITALALAAATTAPALGQTTGGQQPYAPPAYAQPAYGQPTYGQSAYAPPPSAPTGPASTDGAVEPAAPLPDYRPAKPAKPAPHWMVAATETAPPAKIKPTKAPPPNWKPQRRWAIGVTIGSDGAGVDGQYLVTRALVLRARAAYANVDHSQTYDGVRYNGHLRLSNAGGYLDLHPLDGFMHPFMISGGVVSALGGRRHVGLTATPQGAYNIGGHSYTAAQLGTVTGDIGLDKVAPFAGLGFDNTFDTEGGFGFKVLAGVVFSGDPKVNLQSTGGLLSNTAPVQADLQSEEAKIRSAADVFHYYPAVSTGLTYKF